MSKEHINICPALKKLNPTIGWLYSSEGRAVVEWARYPMTDKCSTKRCKSQARATRLGNMCLKHWLKMPQCKDCGKIVAKDSIYNRWHQSIKTICAECARREEKACPRSPHGSSLTEWENEETVDYGELVKTGKQIEEIYKQLNIPIEEIDNTQQNQSISLED